MQTFERVVATPDVFRVSMRRGVGQRRFVGVLALNARQAVYVAARAFDDWRVTGASVEPERPIDLDASDPAPLAF